MATFKSLSAIIRWLFANFTKVKGLALLFGLFTALLLRHVLALLPWHLFALLTGLIAALLFWHFLAFLAGNLATFLLGNVLAALSWHLSALLPEIFNKKKFELKNQRISNFSAY